MMHFEYDSWKATQMAALFIKKEGGRINYTKLIKLMYLADREFLKQTGFSISTSSPVSMSNGPVLSEIYDAIKDETKPEWRDYISKNVYDVDLIKDPGSDDFCKAEKEVIDQIYSDYGHYSYSELINITHKLPEWRNPGSTSIPINIKELLKILGKTDSQIEFVEQTILQAE